MKFSFRPLLAISSFAILLSGCSEETLDYRNAQFSNGKIYNGQDNTPFTGIVTNLPHKDVFKLPDDASRVISGTMGLLNKHEETDHQFNIFQLSCNSKVKDGLLSGITTCQKSGSDIKRYTSNYNLGYLEGAFTVYALDGKTPLAMANLNGDKLNGDLKFYTPNGKLVEVAPFINGLMHGTQERWSPVTGNLTFRAQAKNGHYYGMLEDWTEDGLKTSEIPYDDDGFIHGLVRAWDGKTGQLILEKAHVHGKAEGIFRQRDESGQYKHYGYYEGGRFHEQPIPADVNSTQATYSDSCIDRWINAYRAENGDEAMINMEQMDEWDTWCAESKAP